MTMNRMCGHRLKEDSGMTATTVTACRSFICSFVCLSVCHPSLIGTDAGSPVGSNETKRNLIRSIVPQNRPKQEHKKQNPVCPRRKKRREQKHDKARLWFRCVPFRPLPSVSIIFFILPLQLLGVLSNNDGQPFWDIPVSG